MWWGRGDTSKLSDEEKVTLAHLRRFEETGHIRALDDKRSETAMRGVDFFAQWESTLRTITSLRNTLVMFGGIIAIWLTFKTQIIAFFTAAGGSGAGP